MPAGCETGRAGPPLLAHYGVAGKPIDPRRIGVTRIDYALRKVSLKLMNRLFRIGPILMLVPVFLWALGWDLLGPPGENHSWFIVWPMFAFVGFAALWHIVLIVRETKHRKAYLAYAILHAPAFYVIWGIAMVLATHFPL